MNANGGAGGGRRNASRRAPKAKAKAGKTKKLGRVALAAIAHNELIVDEYIAAVEMGVESPYVLATIQANPAGEHPGTWAFGGGSFSVRLPEGRYVRANLRKLLQGRGRFHHNPDVSTAVRDGSHVLVEDLGLSGRSGGLTHQIMAVLSADQAARVHMMHGAVAARGRSSSGSRSSSASGGWEFNLNDAAYTGAADRRAALVASALATRAAATAAHEGGYGDGAGAAGAAVRNALYGKRRGTAKKRASKSPSPI